MKVNVEWGEREEKEKKERREKGGGKLKKKGLP